MLKSMTKLIKNVNFNHINYCETKFERFLILKLMNNKSFYLFIPSSKIVISAAKNQLILVGSYKSTDLSFLSSFNQFYNLLYTLNKCIKTPYKKQLRMKGLGFRVLFLNNGTSICFKLGYSHLCTLEIPTAGISVHISKKKNSITILGVNKVLIGDFISKIRCLKIPDKYKGKGFWYKYENEILKEIKKK